MGLRTANFFILKKPGPEIEPPQQNRTIDKTPPDVGKQNYIRGCCYVRKMVESRRLRRSPVSRALIYVLLFIGARKASSCFTSRRTAGLATSIMSHRVPHSMPAFQ